MLTLRESMAPVPIAVESRSRSRRNVSLTLLAPVEKHENEANCS